MSEEVKEEQPSLKTSCRDCLFAVYDNNVQLECRFARLKPFMKQTEVETIEDNEKSYYMIKDRICNRCRHKDNNPPVSIDEFVEQVRKETRLKVDLVLEVKTPDELCSVLDQLNTWTTKPNKLFIINNCAQTQALVYWLTANYKHPWEVVSRFSTTPLINLHHIATKSKHQYILHTSDITKLSVDVLDRLDKLWNDEMVQFACVHDENSQLYGRYLYTKVSCPEQPNVTSVLEEFNKEEKVKVVYKWSELLS